MIIDELQKNLENEDRIHVVGKGDTAMYLDHENAVGINQGIIFTNFKFLFLNDFPSFDGLSPFMEKIEYIFIPDYPHDGRRVSNLNYKDVITYLKETNFEGKVFFYQIQTTKSKRHLKHKFHSKTTSDIPLQFFSKFVGIKKYTCYGIGVSKLYHPDLQKLKFEPRFKEFIDTEKKLKVPVNYEHRPFMERLKDGIDIDEIAYH